MAVAQVMGYNPDTQKYEVLVRSDKTYDGNRQNSVICSYENAKDAEMLAYDVNICQLPNDEFFNTGSKNKNHPLKEFMPAGFAPENDGRADRRPAFLKKIFPVVGCDMPEQGGISGNLNKNKPKSPYVCYLA